MSPKALPKHQHYVPQVLLRGFIGSTREQVFVFDKSDSRVFRTSIRNVAGQRAFYDLEMPEGTATLEPALGRLESGVAPIIARIRSQASLAGLTKEERVSLALFAMVQHQRTVNFRANVSDFNTQVASKFRRMGFDPSRVDGFKEFTKEDLKAFALQAIARAHEFVPYLMPKGWLLLQRVGAQSLYLGDNPISMQNSKDLGPYGNIGLAVPGIEIYLPISSELSLAWFSETLMEEFAEGIAEGERLKAMLPSQSSFIDAKLDGLREVLVAAESGRALPSPDDYVTRLNSLQVRYAERYVYCREDSFDLVREMIAKQPAFRTGPRGRVE